MWECPTCKRHLKSKNQYHICSTINEEILFVNKPDELVRCYADLLDVIANWKPCSVGSAKHTIVFSSVKAWLIVKPMKSQLDLKFFLPEPLQHEKIFKITAWGKHQAHQVRISESHEINRELIEWLKEAHAYSIE